MVSLNKPKNTHQLLIIAHGFFYNLVPMNTIFPYEDKFRIEIVKVWESSVRATHHFVKLEDIEYFKSIVSTIDFNSFSVYCSFDPKGVLIGFLGVAGGKVEMLFLDPNFIGKGAGKQLMEFALNQLNVTEVDVNEQNLNAVLFYEKFGFRTYERVEKDSEGKDYPILKMRLAGKV